MKFLIGFLILISFVNAKEVKNITVESSSAVINISSEEAKSLALRRARSMIIEKANGIETVSNVLVKDGTLALEFIKNYSRGIILNERIKWLPITQYQKDSNSAPIPEYNVKVTADVLITEKNINLVLNSSINKTVFQNGEKISLDLLSSKNANIAMFFLGYDDKVYKLLPTDDTRLLIKANNKIKFPRKSIDNFDLEVVTPKNIKKVTEALWIIAAEETDNIPFNIYFNKDSYSLNDFFSIYANFSDKCIEKIIPYHVSKTD